MASNTLRATISGSFKTADNEVDSYDGVTGLMPRLDDDKAQQMIIRRYARIWIGQAKKSGGSDEPRYRRVQRVREVFIDSIEDGPDGKRLSYIGKNIMDMNFEELQDLAAAKDLAAIPLYKTGSLQHARRVAWSEYAIKVLGQDGSPQSEFNFRNAKFNPAKHAPIEADATIRRDDSHVADIEETLDRESLAMQGKAKAVVSEGSQSRMTLAQLKAVADSKGIQYHASIGYNALYERIYGKKGVAASAAA